MAPKPDWLFRWTNDPDPAWLAELASISRPNHRIPYLQLIWESGDPWDSVQRWEIYEMLPNWALVESWLKDEFFKLGNPRKRGRWVDDHRYPNGKRWETDALISRRQYELFCQTGHFPRRLLIVQGPEGGHLRSITSEAERWFRMRYGGTWPLPGSLGYAEPDRRTWGILRGLDTLQEWERRVGDWENRYSRSDGMVDTGRALKTREQIRQEQEIEFNYASMKWLEHHMEAVGDAITHTQAKQLLEDAPDEGPEGLIPEHIEREFVEAR